MWSTLDSLMCCQLVHWLTKTWIYLTPYLCTERIFDNQPFMYIKVFLKKLLWKLVALIFTLLLASFASKLAKIWRHSAVGLWKFFENGKIAVFEGECRRFRIIPKVLRLTVPRIIDQCGRKRCQKKRKDESYQLLKEFFSNVLLYMNGRLSNIRSVLLQSIR